MGLPASALSLHDTSPSRSQSDSFNTSQPCPSTARNLPSASHFPQVQVDALGRLDRIWTPSPFCPPPGSTFLTLSAPATGSSCRSSNHHTHLRQGLGTALTPLPQRSPNGPLSRLLQVFVQMALSPEDAAWPTHLNFNPLPFLNSLTP